MRAVLIMALWVLRMEMRDRMSLFWMLLMPIAFIGLFGGLFREGGGSRAPRLTVVVEDQGLLSTELVELLRDRDLRLRVLDTAAADSVADSLGITPDSVRAAALSAGRALVVPRGFTDSLASGQRVALRYHPGDDEAGPRDLELKVQVYRAMGRLLTGLALIDPQLAGTEEAGQPRRGIEPRAGGSGTAGSADLGRTGDTIPADVAPAAGIPDWLLAFPVASLGSRGSAADTLPVDEPAFRTALREALTQPDRIRTEIRTAGRGETIPTGVTGSAQAMLVLFLLMNTSISGAVIITQERENRLLARLATLPISRSGLLAGKVLGLLGLGLVQSAAIVIFGRVLFGVTWGDSPVALILLLVCLGLAAAGLGIFLGAVLKSPDQANSVAWIIPLFLGAIGGTWWPLEITPTWMQAFGHISPAAWAMDGIHGLIAFGRGPAAIVVPSLVLLGYAVALTGIGARLLRPSD